VTAAFCLAADVATKWVVQQTMTVHENHQVLGDWVRLTYIHNTGAAFGLFPGSRWALIGVSVTAVAVVVWLAWYRSPRFSLALPLGMVLGGAVGNLIDRVRFGQVVDFINVGVGVHRWPVFNAADSAVTVGVVWLAVVLAFPEGGRRDPDTGP